jgi:hypothetical protein
MSCLRHIDCNSLENAYVGLISCLRRAMSIESSKKKRRAKLYVVAGSQIDTPASDPAGPIRPTLEECGLKTAP